MLGPELETRFPAIIDELCKDGLLLQYPCPLKNRAQGIRQYFVVNWAAYSLIRNHDRQSCLQDALSVAVDAESRQKIVNKLDFLEVLKSSGKQSYLAYSFGVIDVGTRGASIELAKRKFDY